MTINGLFNSTICKGVDNDLQITLKKNLMKTQFLCKQNSSATCECFDFSYRWRGVGIRKDREPMISPLWSRITTPILASLLLWKIAPSKLALNLAWGGGQQWWTTMVDSGSLSCHLHGLLRFKEILKKIATHSCDVLQRLCRAIETN